MQDAGEPGLANVTVRLKNTSGVVLETTTTDANGKYFFYDPMGYYGVNDYQVEFVTPAGYVPSATHTGSDTERDSDPQNGLISSMNVPFGKWDHSFDAGFIPVSTLPAKIISFTATLASTDRANLHWSTASELNVSHFVVEKSTDAVNYYEAGMVLAYGSALDKADYTFNDNLAAINSPVVYYRLRTVDNNGKNQYSATRLLQLGKTGTSVITIMTYPNPVASELRVTIPASWQNKEVVYEVYALNGKLVSKKQTSSSSQTETINTSNLQSGLYFVKAVCGNESAQQKIVKQ
jgi:hypothetical protein